MRAVANTLRTVYIRVSNMPTGLVVEASVLLGWHVTNWLQATSTGGEAMQRQVTLAQHLSLNVERVLI